MNRMSGRLVPWLLVVVGACAESGKGVEEAASGGPGAPPATAQVAGGGESSEIVSLDWFVFQRIYPERHLDLAARLAGFEAARERQASERFVGGTWTFAGPDN